MNNISPISCENKLRFWREYEMTSALCNRPTHIVGFSWVIDYWHNNPREYISHYSDTLFRLRTNHSFLLLLSAVCLAEKRHVPILFGFQILAVSVLEGYSRNVSCGTIFEIYVFMIVFSLTRPGLQTTIYRTRGEHANYYTSDLCLERTWTRFAWQIWSDYTNWNHFATLLGGRRGRMVIEILIEIIQVTGNLKFHWH